MMCNILNLFIVSKFFEYMRKILYTLWLLLPNKLYIANNTIMIDVIIPIIEKDLEVLSICLEGLKKNINNHIRDIYIISPNIKSIRDYAYENHLIFIDEATVFGYSPKDINYLTASGVNRSGWIFQQLIKLSGQVGTSRYYLAIDSDHILLKPHTFLTESNKVVFYQSTEFHYPYYNMNKIILKKFSISLFSFVSHKMLFDKLEIKKLQKKIEKDSKTNYRWDRIIIRNLDANEPSCFSEYELYGSFLDNNKKIYLPWRQKALMRSNLGSLKEIKKRYKRYWSVTYPSYMNK